MKIVFPRTIRNRKFLFYLSCYLKTASKSMLSTGHGMAQWKGYHITLKFVNLFNIHFLIAWLWLQLSRKEWPSCSGSYRWVTRGWALGAWSATPPTWTKPEQCPWWSQLWTFFLEWPTISPPTRGESTRYRINRLTLPISHQLGGSIGNERHFIHCNQFPHLYRKKKGEYGLVRILSIYVQFTWAMFSNYILLKLKRMFTIFLFVSFSNQEWNTVAWIPMFRIFRPS